MAYQEGRKSNILPSPDDSSDIDMLIKSTTAFTEQLVILNEIQNKQFELLKEIRCDIVDLKNFIEKPDLFEKRLKELYISIKTPADEKYSHQLEKHTNKILIAFSAVLGIFSAIVALINFFMKGSGQ